jgi:hypothetical protein
MTASEILRAALGYLARGWSVVVVEPRGKRPIVRWEEFQRRPPGEDQLRAWLARRPDANLAIVTGAVSGLAVLDVDPRHGGIASLARWECDHGALPHSVEAQTGGGGRHLYFEHPGGELRSRVGLAPGLDLRADGGLVVAPPSLHPTGGRYRWLPGRAPDEAHPAPIPGWLLEIARGETPGQAPPLQGWRRRVHEAVPEGRRNDTIASFTGHLLWHGIDPVVARELLRCWNRTHCRPPLSDHEVTRTVESITRAHFRPHEDPAGDGELRAVDPAP